MSVTSYTIQAVFFYLFSAVIIGSALMVVLLRNIVRSAFALFFTLSGVAGIYILLGADFVGVTQVLIYIGGVLILIVFGVMLTHNVYSVDIFNKLGTLVMGTISAIVTFTIIYYSVKPVDWLFIGFKPDLPTARPIGTQLMGTFLLPFELASILLVLAMVGAAYMIRSEVRGTSQAGAGDPGNEQRQDTAGKKVH